MKKLLSITLAALFAASFALSAQAAENPFGMTDMAQSSHLAMSGEPEDKCGGDKKAKCGGDKKEGKCGGDKKESKCGGDKKGKCGGS